MEVPLSLEEHVRIFAESLGRNPASQLTPDETDAARRIVAALGHDPNATVLSADYAREFHLALPALATSLEHPTTGMLVMTPQPPTGGALLAALAVEQGDDQEERGDLAGAEHAFRWATQQFHLLGEREAQSLAVTRLGRAVEMQDRLDEAAACYHQALALDQAVGDLFNQGVDYALLGQVAWQRGQLDEAERYLRQALAIHRRCRDRRSAVSTLRTFGKVAQERGQGWRAQLYFLRATLADHRIM